MRIVDGKEYHLVEADTDLLQEGQIVCDLCALADLCDRVADEMNDIQYCICEEDEDPLENFENPIYAHLQGDTQLLT